MPKPPQIRGANDGFNPQPIPLGTSRSPKKRVQPADVIVEIAEQPVATPEDVNKRIDQLMKDGRKSALLFVANKTGQFRFVGVKIGN
jgi:serine protease Do